MLATVITLAALGAMLLFAGWRISKSSNIDAANSAIVPDILGYALIVSDIVLIVGYALYRLFS